MHHCWCGQLSHCCTVLPCFGPIELKQIQLQLSLARQTLHARQWSEVSDFVALCTSQKPTAMLESQTFLHSSGLFSNTCYSRMVLCILTGSMCKTCDTNHVPHATAYCMPGIYCCSYLLHCQCFPPQFPFSTACFH